MEKPLIESLPNFELNRLSVEAASSGDYIEARQLIDREIARRCLNLCDDPTGYIDALEEV